MNLPEHLHGIAWNMITDEAGRAAFLRRPSVMLGARVFRDGNSWCCLYGENIQEGVAGFGDSPDEACRAFDVSWYAKVSK